MKKNYIFKGILTLFFLIFATISYEARAANKEIKCIASKSFFFTGNKLTNENDAPANAKPTYIKFSGSRLDVYYKVPRAPKVSYDGAMLISQQVDKDGVKVSNYEKTSSDGAIYRVEIRTFPNGNIVLNALSSMNNWLSTMGTRDLCK